MTSWTAERIKSLKGKEKIVCLTAHDYFTARVIDECGIHMILVGDSLGMTALGYETTLPVTMNEMLHHSAAVTRATKNALVAGDMPFMSYQPSATLAVRNAGRFIKEAGVGAVKVEGGAVRADTVRAMVDNGIPVLGHIGLTPQSVRTIGGYKVQGKTEQDADRLVSDARSLERAGVFAIVVECVPADPARRITDSVNVPTIGIGAGRYCDGQILVTNDLLGLSHGAMPRFVKQYADLGSEMRKAFELYKSDVENGVFPEDSRSY